MENVLYLEVKEKLFARMYAVLALCTGAGQLGWVEAMRWTGGEQCSPPALPGTEPNWLLSELRGTRRRRATWDGRREESVLERSAVLQS